MDQILEFLRSVPAFYVATVDEDNRPRVRPFSLVYEWDGKLSFGTNDTKKVYRQLEKNPHVEICAFQPENGKWMRIFGKVEMFKSVETNRRIFETMPSLKEMYGNENNPMIVAFSFVEGRADIYSFASDSSEPVESISLQ